MHWKTQMPRTSLWSRLPAGSVRWGKNPPPRDSHANNFLLFLFAHQTHAACLLFSLSSLQYFMPLQVHLFLAFPVPCHLLSKHNFPSFDTPPPFQPSLRLLVCRVEAIACAQLYNMSSFFSLPLLPK